MQMMDSNSEAISEARWLREKKVQDLMLEKRRLVEVPYTASLADTLNALVANRVSAVPVAAPPGQYIGAGGSMIMESDKITGAVRKHFIGMVTMLDVIAYIAEQLSEDPDQSFDLDKRMSVPVSSIIGHSLESLCLWTLNPNTSLLDCMEVFCRGIHRALVPVEGHAENITGVELAESATSYRMLTQMDILRFFKANAAEMEEILSRPVGELGAIALYVFGVTYRTKAIDAIKCMATASLQAVPIVEASEDPQEDRRQLIDGKGRKLIGTFSATDLRECPVSLLQSWLPLDVMEFTEKLSTARVGPSGHSSRELVTCYSETSLGKVNEMAVNGHVHRVWVVDEQGSLIGIVSLTDILRMIRVSLASLET
ncbi:SNF1-related protein kinase regulatory subunit gamma-like PV42a [Macadamia integrifolia]|uniref:SNF1-related protein kinase regulatory subunit gamma-like PV42a n=1 Tax=Macadamia integrifolia TaxID=60698 RepID=UPI001C4F59B8|nr:SNF1-related protein kinase regulatory subunit gamma-like PV42a [Macadamia integrifolia]